MWDIGGQDSLRNSWNTYFADSDFVIFVVDSTDRERLPISKMEVNTLPISFSVEKNLIKH